MIAKAARRLAVPGVSTLVMLAILLGLGVWQLQRRAWKLGLLAEFARSEAEPAVPLGRDPLPFMKVRVEGHLRDDLAATYGVDVRDTPSGSILGAQLLVPLERPGEPDIIVDRGWIPATDHPASPAGTVAVEGYVRPPDSPGLFSPADDPAKRQFYTLDPARIGAVLGIARVAPFTLVALGPSKSTPDIPDPAHSLPRPPNDHLGYAITWFGLAATLLAVFAAYARRVLTASGADA